MASSRIEIISPLEAEAGATVPYEIRITNIDSISHHFVVDAWAPDTNTQVIFAQNLWLNPGPTWSRSLSFTMPNKDAEIFVWVDVERDGVMDYDNSQLETIALLIPVPESDFRSFQIAEYIIA